MILNERVLRLMVTLAKELHFGRAAAALHVSQPALSGTVKSLERDLGVRLFKRTSRNVELTEAGCVFVAEAARLLQEGDRAVALVRRSSSGVSGPLQIGYPATMNPRWLGALIAHARRVGLPSADLQFVSADPVNLQEDLVKRTLHAAFLVGKPGDPELRSAPLFRENYAVVLGPRHPLACSASLSLERLQDEPVVWLRRDVNPILHDRFMTLCSAQGFRPRIVQEVRTFYECLQFAREGVGITFLPPFMRWGDADGEVAFVRLLEGGLQVEYTLAWCRDSASHGVDRFVRFVQDYLGRTSGVAHVPAAPRIDQHHQSI